MTLAGDVRRQAGWLPASQDALEDWLAGHRQRVEAKGRDIELHPAVVDLQRLVASDPVVGMYVPNNRSSARDPLVQQAAPGNPDQMFRLINQEDERGVTGADLPDLQAADRAVARGDGIIGLLPISRAPSTAEMGKVPLALGALLISIGVGRSSRKAPAGAVETAADSPPNPETRGTHA